MAKKQLRTQPAWSIPTDEELAQSLPGKAVKHFEDYHEGLVKIECEAVWMNDAGAKVPGSIFQSFEIDGGGRGRVPAFNPMTLARIVWLRCNHFAAKKKRKVNFVVQLIGSEADGKSWAHRVRFTLDGTPDDLTDEDQEEDKVEEEELGDEELDDSNRRLSDHARQLGGDTPGGFVKSRPLPLPPGQHVGQGELEVMPPAMLNHSAASEHGMNGSAQTPVVLRTPGSESAMLVRALQGAYGGALAEHRALVEQIRLDRTADRNETKGFVRDILEENRRGTKQVVDALLARLDATEARAEKAEGRIIEMSKLESGEREFNMQVAQQGWVSFIEGMRMKAESVSVQQEYDRAFLGLQLQSAKSGKTTSAAGSALKNLLPFAATGLSAILRARGDENSAHTIDELSKMVTRATIGAAAAEGAQAQGQAAQQQQAAGSMPPIIAAIRNLYDSLRPDQSQQLKTLMPGPAWSLLEGAAKTDIEAACIACLTSMNGFMDSDPSISLRVIEALDEPQQQQLIAIVQAIRNAGPPKAAPVAATPRPNGTPTRPPVFAHAKPGAAPPRRMPPRPGAAPPATEQS